MSNNTVITFCAMPHEKSCGKRADSYAARKVNGPYVPWKWQREFIDKCWNTQLQILVAYTGSGKSIATLAVLHKREIEEPDDERRSLIVVPCSHLGENFDPDNGEYSIVLDANRPDEAFTATSRPQILTEAGSQDVVAHLTQFLLDRKDTGSRITITTHACLREAWKKMDSGQKYRAGYKLHLYVDEAHHVGNAGADDDEGDVTGDPNNLGSVVNSLLEHYQEQQTHILCITATFFRSEGMVIGKKYLDDFEVYHQDIIEHVESLELDDLRFGLIAYAGDPIEAAAQGVYDETRAAGTETVRSIVRIPGRGRSFRADGQDYNDPEKIKNTFRKKINNLFGRKVNVVYFLSDDHADDKKDFKENKNSVDVVVAMNLFDEGTDWPQANRLFDLAPGQSPVRAIQVPGRLLRARKEKKTVAAFTMVSADTLDVGATMEDLQEVVSSRFRAITVLLVFAGEIFPSLRKLPVSKTLTKKMLATAEKISASSSLARDILGQKRLTEVITAVLASHEMSDSHESRKEILGTIRNAVNNLCRGLPEMSAKEERRLYDSIFTEASHVRALSPSSTTRTDKLSSLQIHLDMESLLADVDVMEKEGWTKDRRLFTLNMSAEQIKHYKEFLGERLRQKNVEVQCSFMDKTTGKRCATWFITKASNVKNGPRCKPHRKEQGQPRQPAQPRHTRPCATPGCKRFWTGQTQAVEKHKGLFYCKECKKNRGRFERPCATPGCKRFWTGATADLKRHKGLFYCRECYEARKKAGVTPGGGACRKLTDDQVREIRKLVEEGETQLSVAKKYGFDPGSVSKILQGKIYRSVTS
jgi:hypothetical protein